MSTTEMTSSKNEQKSFEYESLVEAGAIRLLRIQRKAKDSMEPLRCVLNKTKLDACPRFVALSYCWGAHTKSDMIMVNDKLMHATESLVAALNSLASPDHEVVLWADAICINQTDALEKTQQVQMMRDIYRAAERVIIWLGPSTSETRYTVRELCRLGDRLIDAGLWNLRSEEILHWDVEDDNDSQSAMTKRSILEMKSEHERQARNDEYPFWWIMSDLSKRKWFSRAWCIQECTNAKTAIFRCGKDEVEFTRVWAVALYFKLYNSRSQSDPNIDTNIFWKDYWLGNMLSDAIPTTTIGIRRRYLTTGELNLRTLLNRVLVKDSSTESIDASDPRDLVYSLLGIASDAPAREITADYRLSCEEAYIMTAKALLRHGHDDVLSLCRMRGCCTNLPTWVPDWSAALRKPWSTWHNNTRLFHAGGSSDSFTICGVDSSGIELGRCVSLQGVFVDAIKDVGHTFEQGINDSMDWTKLKEYFNDIAKYLSESKKYTTEQKEEAEWRIPVGDTEVSGTSSQTKRALLGSHMKDGFAVARAIANGSVSREEMEKSFLPLACFQCQLGRMYDSRPFLSQSGYVGLCPLETQPGDVIFVFPGAQVPYILRRTGSLPELTLIGESHVYGIMDGEFILSDPTVEQITLI